MNNLVRSVAFVSSLFCLSAANAQTEIKPHLELDLHDIVHSGWNIGLKVATFTESPLVKNKQYFTLGFAVSWVFDKSAKMVEVSND